jgi:hypothetical protein
VRLLHVCLVCTRGGPLSGESFRGFRLLPTYALSVPLKLDPAGEHVVHRHAVEGPAEHVQPFLLWQQDGELFWEMVFHSLLEGGGPAICQRCGAMLGDRTPTGRKKKQAHCPRCRWRTWWHNQPTEKRRARWNADYRKRTKRAPR